MKKIFLSLVLAILAFALQAQSDLSSKLAKGDLTAEAYADQLTSEIVATYGLSEAQSKQVQLIMLEKASIVQEIQEAHGGDASLIAGKHKSLESRTNYKLSGVMTKEQYSAYAIKYRQEQADLNNKRQNKTKKASLNKE